MIFTVSQINRKISQRLMSDPVLNDVCVQGEVSEVTDVAGSGHMYFSLKDSRSTLRCALFANYRREVGFEIRTGMKLEVRGSVSVYEPGGYYNLKVTEVRQAGDGALYEEYLKLQKRLRDEGLFDSEHKKEIPKYIRTLGVVTSKTGAVIQDIKNVSGRRNPYVNIVLCPAKVQGDGAALSIISALKRLDAYGCDTIIVGRGGGSVQDLWCFNDENLARTVYAMKTPVISAVGHETDTTIIDFVSDMRAPTPSAAAELAVFDYYEMSGQLVDIHADLVAKVGNALKRYQNRADALEKLLGYKHPRYILNQKKQWLDDAELDMKKSISDLIAVCYQGIAGFEKSLRPALERKKNTAELKLDQAEKSLKPLLVRKLNDCLGELSQKEVRMKPLLKEKLVSAENKLEKYEIRSENLLMNSLGRTKNRTDIFEAELRRLSPLEKATKGFAFVESEKGQVRSIKDIDKGEKIKVTVNDGAFLCEVKDKKEGGMTHYMRSRNL